jgi:hypothetical protein
MQFSERKELCNEGLSLDIHINQLPNNCVKFDDAKRESKLPKFPLWYED